MADQPDLDVVRLYWPMEVRPALDALFAIDAAMGDVVRTTSEPVLGAIRLAWWRERLEALDQREVPAEPRLQAAADQLVARGISGRELATLETGWLPMFDPFPWGTDVASAIASRGRHLFHFGERLVGQDSELLQQAGGLWTLIDGARHCTDGPSRSFLFSQARILASDLADSRVAKAQRPLGLLAALAARDVARGEPFEPEATPGRAAALLLHRLTGRFPRRN